MLLNTANFLQSLLRNRTVVRFHLLTVMVLLIFSCVSPAFGDAYYSDSWGDNSESSGLNINSASVTDGTYTHEYYVEIELKSPNNRIDGGAGSEAVGYTLTEATLSYDWNDVGDYRTRATHWSRCPGGIFFAATGLSSALLPVGFSMNVMYHWRDGTYLISDDHTCSDINLTCRKAEYTSSTYLGEYILYWIPKIGSICFDTPFTRKITEDAANQPCLEL